MRSRERLFENRILLLWFAKALKHFIKKELPFYLIVIGCFCYVMNDHPPLGSTYTFVYTAIDPMHKWRRFE